MATIALPFSENLHSCRIIGLAADRTSPDQAALAAIEQKLADAHLALPPDYVVPDVSAPATWCSDANNRVSQRHPIRTHVGAGQSASDRRRGSADQ
jgi:hypothetical protein